MPDAVMRPRPEPPYPCHHHRGCDVRDMVHAGAAGPPYEPEHLDNGEMRAVLHAAREATGLAFVQRHEIRAARTEVITRYAECETAVRALARLAAAGTVRSARGALDKVDSRHAGDGARDRRRREPWLRWLRWPLILALAVFDAWFFQQVFQYMTVTDEEASTAEWIVSFLPGVALALALMLAGHILAPPVHLIRARLRERLRNRFRSTIAWALTGPLLFALALSATIAIWAVLRARNATGTDTREYPPWAVGVLMLLFACTAIAVKVMTYNPYADSADEARRGLDRSSAAYRRAVGRAEQTLTRHELAWSELRCLCDETASRMRASNIRTWETMILPARMLHGQAGHRPPQLRAVGSGTGPAGEADAHTNPPDTTRVFQGVAEPPPALGPLAEAYRVVEAFDPARLRVRLAEIVADLDRQSTPVRRGSDDSGPAEGIVVRG